MLFRYGRISKRPADMQSSKKLEFEYKGRYLYVLLIRNKFYHRKKQNDDILRSQLMEDA